MPGEREQWTVRRVDGEGPWIIRRNGREVDTIKGHYGAIEVLTTIEDIYIHAVVRWMVNEHGDGFNCMNIPI
jgi:hypothetical protein